MDNYNLMVGDVVVLKSGGPDLTIENISDVVSCVWHDGDGYARAAFPAVCLRRVK